MSDTVNFLNNMSAQQWDQAATSRRACAVRSDAPLEWSCHFCLVVFDNRR